MADEVPGVICAWSDQFRSHLGAAWRLVAAGSIIRVADGRSGEVLGYITRRPPPELAGREHLLPPATVSDALGPEPPPELPPSWVVREDAPEPQAEVA